MARKQKHKTIINITDSIGVAIQNECQIRYYRKTHPGLFNSIVKHYWHNAMGTGQKIGTTRTLWNRVDDVEPFKSWPSATRIKIGSWYADAICQITNWFSIKKSKK